MSFGGEIAEVRSQVTRICPLLTQRQAFGRPPAMIVALVIFSVGSALSGAAQNVNFLIGARGMSYSLDIMEYALIFGVQPYKVSVLDFYYQSQLLFWRISCR